MRVLLSIKPEYAEMIFTGQKKYEFRRAIFKNKAVQTVVVYASSPVKKVIGEFEIESILSIDLDTLWKKTKKHSGITEDFFFDYFDDCLIGHAIKIKSFKRYTHQQCIFKDFQAHPPQSFIYLK